MKNFILILFFTLLFIGIANAFNNSLDQGFQNQPVQQQNNLATPNSNGLNSRNNNFDPKNHDSMQHQQRQFPDSSNNPSRYNTNCQFGICIPGGINPNSR